MLPNFKDTDPSGPLIATKFVFLASFLLSSSFVSCAAFKGSDLQEPENPQIIRTESGAAVAFKWMLVRTPSSGRKFEETILASKFQRIFYDSKAFTKPSLGKVNEAYKLHLILEIKEPGSSPSLLGTIWGWSSGVTFGVIPFHIRTDYLMAVTVEKDGQLLKRYEYRRDMHFWIQFPLLLVAGPFFLPNDVEKEIIEELFLALRNDLSRDHVIVHEIGHET